MKVHLIRQNNLNFFLNVMISVACYTRFSTVFPLERIVDAGVPIVFAGLPKARTFLISEHPDIPSRLKTLVSIPREIKNCEVKEMRKNLYYHIGNAMMNG